MINIFIYIIDIFWELGVMINIIKNCFLATQICIDHFIVICISSTCVTLNHYLRKCWFISCWIHKNRFVSKAAHIHLRKWCMFCPQCVSITWTMSLLEQMNQWNLHNLNSSRPIEKVWLKIRNDFLMDGLSEGRNQSIPLESYVNIGGREWKKSKVCLMKYPAMP